MFGFFSKKKAAATSKEKDIKDIIQDIYYRRKEILESSLQELESGNLSFLKNVYCGIAFNQNDENYINRTGKCTTTMLNRMNCIQKIQLSESFREYTSMEWYEDWSKFNPLELRSKFSNIEYYINILILGSFHPNGFYREKCIILLQQYEQALPFIFLRLNDWVML